MEWTGQTCDDAKRDLTADVIRQFGEARLKVTGASMLPSVWPGDVITVRRKSAADLIPGQIVLCYRDRKYLAHRLIAKRDQYFFTRGDSLSYDDPPFRENEVLGEVCSIQRNGREVALSTSWWHSGASWIVRHSDLCSRVLPRLLSLRGPSWAR
jgi:signal peptidase I